MNSDNSHGYPTNRLIVGDREFNLGQQQQLDPDFLRRSRAAQQPQGPNWLITGSVAHPRSAEAMAQVRAGARTQLGQQNNPDILGRQAGRPDMVHQPAHYARYVIEPVTFIGANKLPFDVGNVVKYVCRYDAKNGLEDLEKAKRYVEIIIERVRREQRVANGERAQAVWSEII